MAGYQVLPAPATSGGFFGGLLGGVSQGLSSYGPSLMRNKSSMIQLDKRADLLKSLQQMKGPATQDPTKQLNNQIANIKMAALSGNPKQLPDYQTRWQDIFGQAEQARAEDMFSNGLPSTDPNEEFMSKPEDANVNLDPQIMQSALGQYAPGMGQDEVVRKIMGIGQPAKPAKPNPLEDFKTDLASALNDAGGESGDPQKFIQNLKNLSLKYADNPAAIMQIQRYISLNTPKKTEDVDMGSYLKNKSGF